MTTPTTGKLAPRDLLSLMSAPMLELLAELDAAASDTEEDVVPSRAVQIGDLVVAEAVRLIRLGTRVEVVDAAMAVSQALVGPTARRLAPQNAEAQRLLFAASTMLVAAMSPSSNGGELTVLRSWNGKALEAVRLVAAEPTQVLERIELRKELKVEESHLSHLLGDLEAAGLVERIREGRTVKVHLGPTARTDHVAKLLQLVEDEQPGASRRAELAQREGLVREVFQTVVEKDELPREHLSKRAAIALREMRRGLLHLRRADSGAQVALGEVVAAEESVIVWLHVRGCLQARREPLDYHVLWTVVMEGEEIGDVKPWTPTSDWLDGGPGTGSRPLSWSMPFTGVPEERGLTMRMMGDVRVLGDVRGVPSVFTTARLDDGHLLHYEIPSLYERILVREIVRETELVFDNNLDKVAGHAADGPRSQDAALAQQPMDFAANIAPDLTSMR
ncbi:MAG TPA: hypothetical protein VNY52_00590 [Solirubrobacteraceae bacterium]|jgi:hypothetical protein|nr:hypothetical protein [Solirubrobacteraceae bacterium]